MREKKPKVWPILILLGALWTLAISAAPLQAQEDVLDEEVADVDEEAQQAALAKAAQNPLASMISVPVQNNTSFGIGPFNRTSNAMNFQPVIPISLSKSLNLITRTIIPVIAAPGVDTNFELPPNVVSPDPVTCARADRERFCGRAHLEQDTQWGLGDMTWTGFFTPANPGAVMVGAGPVLQFRTGTSDDTGSGKWGAGPSVVLVATPGSALLGLLVNNVWSFAGDPDRADVNHMLIQYFINYNLPKGWYLSSAPIITSDWTKPASQGWIVPFGAGGGRVFNIGRQPVNTQIQAFYNAVTPKTEEGVRVGPEWSLRLQFQLLFPQ
jgi:hypothetical protein